MNSSVRLLFSLIIKTTFIESSLLLINVFSQTASPLRFIIHGNVLFSTVPHSSNKIARNSQLVIASAAYQV